MSFDLQRADFDFNNNMFLHVQWTCVIESCQSGQIGDLSEMSSPPNAELCTCKAGYTGNICE